MEKVLKVQSVNDYASYVGAPVLHPLVSVVHYDELEQCRHCLCDYGVYALFLMEESPYTCFRHRRNGAGELCLSPNYFGDLVRARTGESATQYIRHFLMGKARRMLRDGRSVSAVSDALGFAYPQHFTRMFTKEFGVAPSRLTDRR